MKNKTYQLTDYELLHLIKTYGRIIDSYDDLERFINKVKKRAERDMRLWDSIIENQTVLYIVNFGYGDIEVYDVTITKKLDEREYIVEGIDHSLSDDKTDTYYISNLYTKEEVEKTYNVRLKD